MNTNNGGPLTSVCETWRHPLGWELLLLIDGHLLQMSSMIRSVDAVRSSEAMSRTIEEWRRGMLEKGWKEAPQARADATDPLS